MYERCEYTVFQTIKKVSVGVKKWGVSKEI